MRIITDHKWKQFKYRNEVPDTVLKDQFSHLSEDDFDGFFQYRKYWYHTSDFLRIENDPVMKNWQGYYSDTYFSGILLRISKDGEQYQVGRYYS